MDRYLPFRAVVEHSCLPATMRTANLKAPVIYVRSPITGGEFVECIGLEVEYILLKVESCGHGSGALQWRHFVLLRPKLEHSTRAVGEVT